MQPRPVHSPDKLQMGARLPDLRDYQQVSLAFIEKVLNTGGIAAYLLSVATNDHIYGLIAGKEETATRICRFYRFSHKERRSGIYAISIAKCTFKYLR